MGRYVAKVIQEDLEGKRWLRDLGFHYKDLGSMATIGRSRAIAQVGRVRMSGFFAWLAWLALHITVLIGFRNRFSVLISWIYSYVFARRGSRLITRSVPAPAPDIPSARQNQPATQPR